MENYMDNSDIIFEPLALAGACMKNGWLCIPGKYVHQGGAKPKIILHPVKRKSVGNYGETHILKPVLPKDTYNAFSDEEKKAIPIVGNVRGNSRKKDEQKPAAQPVSWESKGDDDQPPF